MFVVSTYFRLNWPAVYVMVTWIWRRLGITFPLPSRTLVIAMFRWKL